MGCRVGDGTWLRRGSHLVDLRVASEPTPARSGTWGRTTAASVVYEHGQVMAIDLAPSEPVPWAGAMRFRHPAAASPARLRG